MSIKVGVDFGTSNSGIAVYDGQRVKLLPVDAKNVLPEVIKTVLYITRDYRPSIGQEAVETYYRDNVNRQRRYVKQWAGEIDVRGADMHYVRDIYVYVDELKPGRLLQYLKTALRKDDYKGTYIFERYYTVGDLAKTYLSLLKQRAENILGESIEAATLGRRLNRTTRHRRLFARPRMRRASRKWTLNWSQLPRRWILNNPSPNRRTSSSLTLAGARSTSR